MKKRVVVLGAGVTGLAAAYRLARDGAVEVDVVDKEPVAGGICRSFREGDFILDHGPHKFYTLVDGVLEDLQDLMGDELVEREKRQSLFLFGKYFAFPLKMTEMLTRFPPLHSLAILASFVGQILTRRKRGTPTRYDEFLVSRFGRGLYERIFEPMARKIYGDPATLDRKLAEVRISSPGLLSIVKQMLFRSRIDRTISAPTFHYPRRGYGRIPDRLKEAAERGGARFHLGARVDRIETAGGKVSGVRITRDGRQERLACDELVYTIPISQLDRLLPEAGPEVAEACEAVGFRHTIIYYFLLKSEPVLPSMWVFFPERKFRFGRLSEMTKFSPETAPPGHTALMVDFTCDDDDPTWKMDDDALGALLYEQMEPLRLFRREQILKRFSRRFRSAYPVYRAGFQEHIEAIRRLEARYGNLYFIGRLGDFNYNNADQCLDMGFRAAEWIRGEVSGTSWPEIRRRRFDQYRIVD